MSLPDLGLILHWGLYSVPAFDDPKSAAKRKTQNGSEWYLKRLTEKNTFRPVSGYKATQEFHKKHHGDKTYFDFATEFKEKSAKIKFAEYTDLAKKVGAKYIILTAKHHDGFCLWKSNHSSCGYVDILPKFIEACKAAGLEFGIYYSLFEFNKNVTREFVDKILLPQLRELLEFKPHMLWLDGHWAIKTQYATGKLVELLDEQKKIAPKMHINDRISVSLKEYTKKNYLGVSTFRVYDDRFLPSQADEIKVPWQHINTIGLSWGRNKQIQPYKSGKELWEIYTKVTKANGTVLFNLGPDAEGQIDPREYESLLEFCQKKSSERA